MTDTCSCPPGDCPGGHTIDAAPPPLLTDDQLRQLLLDPHADYGITAMAAELLALRARVAELEADSINRDFGIQAMSIAPGESTLTTKPTTERARRLVLAMSLACGRMLDEDQAPNYVEFEVSPAGQPGYVVHVRRAGGPSPHSLRQAAEARAERAEARVAELEAEAQAEACAIDEARGDLNDALDRVAAAETARAALIESWESEANGHRLTGHFGIAEGLRIAIDGLREVGE